MQKKLIALAVAGLASTAAFAQSNVTIYGVADATFDSVKATGAAAAAEYQSRNRVTANSSYIGFKGVEDLGNGLKAVFQFESGISQDFSGGTAASRGGQWANRDSFVGLTGGFGTLVAGNLTGPTRALGAKLDVNSGATGIGANTALLGKLGGGSGAGAFDQRITNAIAYVSPTVAGFSAVAGYSTGLVNDGAGLLAANAKENQGVGSPAAGTVNTAYTLGANYAAGPVDAGYAYTRVAVNGASNDLYNHRVGGIFKFAAGQVGLLWDQTTAQAAAGNLKQNVWYVSGKYNVTGNGAVIAQYGRAGDVKNTAGKESANHFVLGYEHSLSKRTVLKAVYSAISNNNNTTYDYLYGVSAANTTATAAAGVGANNDPRGFSVGVRHAF